MGELFRRTLPAHQLEWTGERLVTQVSGPIEDEHLHRYFIARDLCREKIVLDVASGEGYGTALLAQTALQAIGVELNAESVAHAAQHYQSPNLRYVEGNATSLPIDNSSMDVVVSFETLEHFSDQTKFFAEVARVLKPDGTLIISTPDAEVYSGPGVPPNPYHIRELTLTEFQAALCKNFENVAIYRQRAAAGSTIWPDAARCGTPAWIYDQRSADTFEIHRTLPRSPYFFALASNAGLPCLPGSLFLRPNDRVDPNLALQAELERLRGIEAQLPNLQAELQRMQQIEHAYKIQEPIIADRLAAGDRAQQETVRLQSEMAGLRVENTRLSALEIAYRAQEPVITQRLAAADKLQHNIVDLRAEIAALKTENSELREGLVRHGELELERMSGEIERRRTEALTLRQQLESSTLLARQQTLAAQRLQQEIVSQAEKYQQLRSEADSLKRAMLSEIESIKEAHDAGLRHMQESQRQIDSLVGERESLERRIEIVSSDLSNCQASAARCERLVRELSSLIIPVWARKLLPPSLRPAARALKKSLRA